MNTNFWYFYRKYRPIIIERLKEIGETTPLKSLVTFILTSPNHLPGVLTILVTKLLRGDEQKGLDYAILVSLVEAFMNVHGDFEGSESDRFAIFAGDVILFKALEMIVIESNEKLVDYTYELLVNYIEGKKEEMNKNYIKAVDYYAELFRYAFRLATLTTNDINTKVFEKVETLGKIAGKIYYYLIFAQKGLLSIDDIRKTVLKLLDEYEVTIRGLPQSGYREILKKFPENLINSLKEKNPKFADLLI